MLHYSSFKSFLVLTILIFLFTSCKKESVINGSNALLLTSEDTLHFDTVFTSVGSVTQSFKIFNPNDQKIRLSAIELSGRESSSFKINVNGLFGSSFRNIDIAANDSIYVFVSVTINPNSINLPFIVQDSILIEYNTNQTFVQLDAYGKNANFLSNFVISKDTVWNNNLPFVVLGSLEVKQGRTLTINKGVQIYVHADAPILINGTLKVLGEKYDSTKVTFTGDRLDEPYNYFPGSWPGIFFATTSVNSELHYTNIRNATQGVILNAPAINNKSKLQMFECIIDNSYDAGVYSVNSSLYAQNCLITNCGASNITLKGGSYNFIHCTVAGFNTQYLYHALPVLFISDTDDNATQFTVQASFTNCIIYGESGLSGDEQSISKIGNQNFSVTYTNTLFKGEQNSLVQYNNCVQNENPAFSLINIEDNEFDFHLQPSSPCINSAVPTSLQTDLDGNLRNNSGNKPDIGCYEAE